MKGEAVRRLQCWGPVSISLFRARHAILQPRCRCCRRRVGPGPAPAARTLVLQQACCWQCYRRRPWGQQKKFTGRTGKTRIRLQSPHIYISQAQPARFSHTLRLLSTRNNSRGENHFSLAFFSLLYFFPSFSLTLYPLNRSQCRGFPFFILENGITAYIRKNCSNENLKFKCDYIVFFFLFFFTTPIIFQFEINRD